MPRLDALAGSLEEAANLVGEPETTPDEPQADIASLLGHRDDQGFDGVDASRIEAPGVVYDKYSGKVWTLPNGAKADMGPLLYRSPRDFKKDPDFHYQSCSIEELSEMVAQGFVPVTRREVGVENFTHPVTPTPIDAYYTIDGKDIIVKIPRQIGQARYEALSDYCTAAISGVNAGRYTSSGGEGPVVESDGEADPKTVKRQLRTFTDRHEPKAATLAAMNKE